MNALAACKPAATIRISAPHSNGIFLDYTFITRLMLRARAPNAYPNPLPFIENHLIISFFFFL